MSASDSTGGLNIAWVLLAYTMQEKWTFLSVNLFLVFGPKTLKSFSIVEVSGSLCGCPAGRPAALRQKNFCLSCSTRGDRISVWNHIPAEGDSETLLLQLILGSHPSAGAFRHMFLLVKYN